MFYAVLINEGIVVLNGTTSQQHMKGDLAAVGLEVEAADRSLVMALCQ